jgi:hypothetical protein
MTIIILLPHFLAFLMERHPLERCIKIKDRLCPFKGGLLILMKFSKILISAFFLHLVTACIPEGSVGQQSLSYSTVEPQPVTPGAGETTSPEKLPLADRPALIRVLQSEEEDRLVAQPIDRITLADLPDFSPIDFGHHYVYAISPDGTTMALISWPNGIENQGGELRLIDLHSWTDRATAATFDAFVGALIFSLDGKQLYWSEPSRNDPAHGMPRDFILYRYNLDRRTRTEVMRFPSTFIPWEMRLLDKGSRMGVYGLPTTPGNLSEDVPHVLLVDLDEGSLAHSLRLEGVAAGQSRVEPPGRNESPYRSYLPGLAWDLERSLLYLVHADEDRITVVDLGKGEIQRRGEVHPVQSVIDRIFSVLATPVQAKLVPGTEKKAVLSPEGDRLYILGLRSELDAGMDGQNWRQIPLGLQVIATHDFSELQRVDLLANNLALSPDGKSLLLTSAHDALGAEGQLKRITNGLYLLDTRTLQVKSHLLPEEEAHLLGFSADSLYGYVSTSYSEWQEDQWGNWRMMFHLLELESGEFVASRELPGYYLEVIR